MRSERARVAAASSDKPGKTDTARRTCGARNRSGRGCELPHGWGTDHPGFGHCRFHGGASPSGRKHAAKIEAATLGAELQIEPHDAILIAVRKAAMWERFCAAKVADLDDSSLVVSHVRESSWESSGDRGRGSETTTETRAELHLWLREHQHAVRDLAHLAKVALDAGVQERQVRLAEQLADDWGQVLRSILDDLKLSADQQRRAPGIVQRHLRVLEGGVAA